MLADRFGLSLSTSSAAARDAYVDASERALTFYPGALPAYDRAIAAEPGFALAHAGKTQVLMREGNVAGARAALGAAKELVANARRATSQFSIWVRPDSPRRQSPPSTSIWRRGRATRW
jgi:hypothetical protein